MAQRLTKLGSVFVNGSEDGTAYYVNNVLYHSSAAVERARWAMDLAVGKMDSKHMTSFLCADFNEAY